MPLRSAVIAGPALLLFLYAMAGPARSAEDAAGSRRFSVAYTTALGGLPVAETPAGLRRRPRIGLALAGGGAKAAASLGVLKVLRQEGIPIDAIAGTSMGSFVGGLAAAGYDPDRIESIFLENDWNDLFTDTPTRAFLTQEQKVSGSRHLFQFTVAGGRFTPPAGLTAGQKLAGLLTARTLAASFQAGMDFDRLPIPFRAIATDLETGSVVAIRRGLLQDALRASAAIPVVFPPVEIEGRLLVDGGLVNNLPVDVTRDMGVDLVIAVDASSPLEQQERLTSLVDVLNQSTSLSVRMETERQAARADIVIAPDTSAYSFADFARMAGIIRAGEEAAAAALPKIRSMIRERTRHEVDRERLLITSMEVRGCVTVPERAVRDAVTAVLMRDWVDADDIAIALTDLSRLGVFAAVSLDLTPAGAGYAAVLTVTEHPVVDAIRISGANLVPAGEIMDGLDDQLGRTLNVTNVVAALDRVIKRYRDRGYLLARVSHAGMEPDGKTLAISLAEGRLDKVVLKGLRRTRTSLIRREMTSRPGRPLNVFALSDDIQRLYALTYFESINLAVEESGTGGVVVTLRMKERHRGSLRLGLRYDLEDAFTGLADIVVDNLMGRGIRFFINTRFGNYLDLAMGYHSPVLLNAYFVHTIEAFYRDRTYSLYGNNERTGEVEVSRTGGDFAFGYEWFRFGDTYLRYRFTSDRTTAVYGAPQPENPTQIGSLAFLTTVDTRDSYAFPHKGVLFQGSYEVADRSYGGDIEFRKTALFGQAALPLGGRHTILVEAAAGFGSGTLPYQEQYGIGGGDHLLGFPLPGYQRREFVGANQLGGAVMYRWRAARYQLSPVKAVYLQLAGGAANVWETREVISTRRMWTGAGIGVHADTVVGPFRLDFGAGEDHRHAVYFSAGFDF
jgi:NTE family protein